MLELICWKIKKQVEKACFFILMNSGDENDKCNYTNLSNARLTITFVS